MKRTIRFGLRILAVAAPAVLCTAAPASPPPAPLLPRSVTVATSRGEFVLRVHPPGPSTEGGAAGDEPRPAILMVSGEGGWRSFDGLLAGILQDRGFWVGGVDAMKYFWSPQDDRRALAADMRAFAEALLKEAGRPAGAPIILAGYSFGADLAPWIAGEGSWKGRVRGIVMVGPDEAGSLEFRVLEVLGLSDPTEHSFPVAGALKDSAGIPTLFVHGDADRSSAAVTLAGGAAAPKRLVVVAGANHHFTGKETELRAAIAGGMDWILTAR